MFYDIYLLGFFKPLLYTINDDNCFKFAYYIYKSCVLLAPAFFDISIIRGRTRSQSAPMTENKDQKIEKEKEESPDSQKRSTRSSRQKGTDFCL